MFSVIGQVPPQLLPQCARSRSARDPVQSALFTASLVVSLHKLEVFSGIVDLTSLVDSIMTFTTAFSIEIFMSSRQAWVKISVGIALAMMIVLVSWGVWVTSEAGTGFSVLRRAHLWKDRLLNFTGVVPEPKGEGKDRDGLGKSGKLCRPRTLKEVFNFIRPQRQRRASTSSKLNLNGSNGALGPPDGQGVESEINSKEQGSAV